MYRSTCLLRIGAHQVYGLWQPPSWGKGAAKEAVAEFGAGEQTPSLGVALDTVLRTILPERELTSPFVRVSLAGRHVTAAILPFVSLPDSAADRSLLISQRFCRDHRLEPDAFTVIACSHGVSKIKEGKILCLAVERSTLDEIRNALAQRGMHPDIIAPDYLLRFEEADGGELERPGVLLMEQNGSNTILIWDQQGMIIHVAKAGNPNPDDFETQRRIVARVRRYAQIAGEKDVPAVVYIDGQVANGIVASLLRPAHGLNVLRLPVKTAQEMRHSARRMA